MGIQCRKQKLRACFVADEMEKNLTKINNHHHRNSSCGGVCRCVHLKNRCVCLIILKKLESEIGNDCFTYDFL
jgi:hypothetical protein